MWFALVLVVVAGCGRINFDTETGDGPIGGSGVVYVVSGDGSNAPTELLTLDLATAELTLVGTIGIQYGIIGGLAYWDANTLYGGSLGAIVRITLSPFSAIKSRDITGNYSSLERDGNLLMGVDQDNDTLGIFDPESTMTPIGRLLGVDAYGGDLMKIGGVWYWYSNTDHQMYIVTVTADPVPFGAPSPSVPFVAGMVTDNTGRIFFTADSTDELMEIDANSAQPIGSVILDHDLKSGDMTRSP